MHANTQRKDAKERRQHGHETFLEERLVDLLTDRRHGGDEPTGHRGAHVISQRRDHTLSVDRAADGHRDAGDAIERLCDRQIDHRLRRHAQALVPRIVDHANNLVLDGGSPSRESHMPSNGRVRTEERASGGIVENGDFRRAG